jgi:hypothetical protein
MELCGMLGFENCGMLGYEECGDGLGGVWDAGLRGVWEDCGMLGGIRGVRNSGLWFSWAGASRSGITRELWDCGEERGGVSGFGRRVVGGGVSGVGETARRAVPGGRKLRAKPPRRTAERPVSRWCLGGGVGGWAVRLSRRVVH